MAGPGGPSLEYTDPNRILTPAWGVRSVTKAPRCRDRPCRTSHPWPGSQVPCACSAWPGRGRSAQVVLSGVQKGQIAHLGRQKPPESELAVAAHGGASQRHTTGAVYGRLRTSWDGDGPCGLNLSVGGHTVQNKTKQNKTIHLNFINWPGDHAAVGGRAGVLV